MLGKARSILRVSAHVLLVLIASIVLPTQALPSASKACDPVHASGKVSLGDWDFNYDTWTEPTTPPAADALMYHFAFTNLTNHNEPFEWIVVTQGQQLLMSKAVTAPKIPVEVYRLFSAPPALSKSVVYVGPEGRERPKAEISICFPSASLQQQEAVFRKYNRTVHFKGSVVNTSGKLVPLDLSFSSRIIEVPRPNGEDHYIRHIVTNDDSEVSIAWKGVILGSSYRVPGNSDDTPIGPSTSTNDVPRVSENPVQVRDPNTREVILTLDVPTLTATQRTANPAEHLDR